MWQTLKESKGYISAKRKNESCQLPITPQRDYRLAMYLKTEPEPKGTSKAQMTKCPHPENVIEGEQTGSEVSSWSQKDELSLFWEITVWWVNVLIPGINKLTVFFPDIVSQSCNGFQNPLDVFSKRTCNIKYILSGCCVHVLQTLHSIYKHKDIHFLITLGVAVVPPQNFSSGLFKAWGESMPGGVFSFSPSHDGHLAQS